MPALTMNPLARFANPSPSPGGTKKEKEFAPTATQKTPNPGFNPQTVMQNAQGISPQIKNIAQSALAKKPATGGPMQPGARKTPQQLQQEAAARPGFKPF